jgi:hypothetical protein
MIDQKRIDELKALCDQATPGPWELNLAEDGIEVGTVFAVDRPLHVVCFMQYYESGNGEPLIDEFDAGLIAAARDALPELIAEVERLRTALEMYANENNWSYYDGAHWCGGMSDQAFGWQPARDALK